MTKQWQDITEKHWKRQLQLLKCKHTFRDTVAVKQLLIKAHSFSADSNWCTNNIKTLTRHNSETEFYLKMNIFVGRFVLKQIRR